MKKLKRFGHLFLFGLILIPTISAGHEPTNLAACKKNIQRYHDSGQYEKDFNKVIYDAIRYLKISLARTAHSKKKPAIVLDIDETSLSNYPSLIHLSFGGTFKQIQQQEQLAIDPVFKSTLRLYQYAKAHHIAVFFVTGRFENNRKSTAENLEKAGYKSWDGLFLRPLQDKSKTVSVYKSATRKHISEQGYNIILNLGDQKSDLVGGYANKSFKLPNPYYFIP